MGNYGILLTMGNAGFISSTVVPSKTPTKQLSGLEVGRAFNDCAGFCGAITV